MRAQVLVFAGACYYCVDFRAKKIDNFVWRRVTFEALPEAPDAHRLRGIGGIPGMPILAVTVLAALSGIYLRASQSWGLLYKSSIFLHPAIGLLWAVLFYRVYRVRQGRSAAAEKRLVDLMGVLLSVGVFLSTASSALVWLLVSASLCAAVAGGAVFVSYRTYGPSRVFFAGLCRTLIVYLALFVSATGGLALLTHRSGSIRSLYVLHAAGGVGFVVVFGVALGALLFFVPDERRRWLRAVTGMENVRPLREGLTVAVFGILAVVLWARDPKEEVRYTFHLSTVPLEQREPHEVDEIPADFAYAPLMASVETCGRSAGCHREIVEDHKRSSHNRSIQTSYFQKNLVFMAEEIGEHNTYICAGCHFPNAYFLAGTDYRDFARRDAYSCLYCHTVDEVVFTEDKGRTILKLKPNVQHLKMFAAADATESGIKPLDEAMIRLNPRGHARVFRKDLYSEEEFCQVCHQLQIKPSVNKGFMKAKCTACHMQPRQWIGKEGMVRNHFFPGTNLAGPVDLGDQDAIRTNTMYSRGEFDLKLTGWGGIWSVIPKEERTIKDIWLLVSIEPLTEVVPGKPFQYRVVTTNTSLDHAFPAAPLDLIEVWLETTVKDAAGTVIFESGVLRPDNTIPPETHKLGGYMIGMDNHLVTKNRVWQIKKKVIEREIRVNEQVQDTYSFVIPENIAPGPLEIYASWNYRKLNQEFVNWAYEPRPMTIPVLRVAETVLKVGGPSKGASYAATVETEAKAGSF